MRDIARFFVRYQIDPENLLYLTREEQRTVLHLLDRRTVATSIPQKEIRAWLGDEDFINICRGRHRPKGSDRRHQPGRRLYHDRRPHVPGPPAPPG